MNNIQISGRLGHDVSLRYIPARSPQENETAVGRFSVAVDRGKKNGEDLGTDWFECVAFGRRAETINRFFHKGDWIEVAGSVKVEKYTDNKYKNENGDPITRRTFDVQVEKFRWGPGNGQAQQTETQPQASDPVPHFSSPDEDIPF